MISLFQIGNVNLRGYIQPMLEHAWQTPGKPIELTQSSRVMRPSARHLSKSRDFKLTAIPYTDEYRTRDGLLQQLLNIGGMDTDIIAFDDLSATVEYSRDPADQLDHNTGALLWLHTRGQITEIKPNNQDDHPYNWEFDIKVSTDPYWKPLNNILWSILNSSGITDHYLNEATINTPYNPTLFPSAPGLNAIFTHTPKMFHRTKMTNWGDQFEPDWYKTIELNALGITTHNNTSWSTDTSKVVPLHVDINHWSMPPETIYVFKNLPATGTITITVQMGGDIFTTDTHTTTIDLATVDTAISDAGYTTATTDKLIVGDTHWMPGFVLRDQTKLTQIASALSRTGGAWAGQLNPGSNRITISVPLGVEWFIGNTNRRA